MKEYPVDYAKGIMTIEKEFPRGAYECQIGVQISRDGRIWICIDGESAIRFNPQILKLKEIIK